MLREFSVVEQRYQAVLAVIEDGLSVIEAAAKSGVSRQDAARSSVHAGAEGLLPGAIASAISRHAAR